MNKLIICANFALKPIMQEIKQMGKKDIILQLLLN